MKTETWYMLHKAKSGFIAIVNTHRSGLIDDAEKNYNLKWHELVSMGYSVQKVQVVPVKKKTSKKKIAR